MTVPVPFTTWIAHPAHKVSAPAGSYRGYGAAKALAIALVSSAALLAPATARANDYPTDAVADYVLGCMAANGETATALRQCSCSIDVVSSLISYDEYSQAETVLRMRLGTGEGTALFHIPFTQAIVDKLRRAQAEAEIRCFR